MASNHVLTHQEQLNFFAHEVVQEVLSGPYRDGGTKKLTFRIRLWARPLYVLDVWDIDQKLLNHSIYSCPAVASTEYNQISPATFKIEQSSLIGP